MLSVYSNQQELLLATNPTPVNRIESVDADLLKYQQYAITFEPSNRPELELHVYTPDGIYLTGNHESTYDIGNNSIGSTAPYKHVAVDIVNELSTLGIHRGQYKLVYNLFDNILGSYSGLKLWIKDISPSRRELRLKLSEESSPVLVEQFKAFRTRWKAQAEDNIFDSFVLNFGLNETFQIVNAKFRVNTFDTDYEIVIKLYAPLPSRYGEKSKVWISEEIMTPVLDSINLIPKHSVTTFNTLAAPNFELEEYDGGSVATSYKNWSDLLSSNLQTSQQLIDAQFSGSLSGIKLNINYRLFDNHIHYGSAVERVKNFKYKLDLIEYFSDQIQTVSEINGGNIVQTNLSDLYIKRNRVVSGFDDFEKYLFFESTGSKLYTHYDSSTGSVDPWPKTEPVQLNWQDAYIQWSTLAAQWNNVNQNNLADPYTYFAIQVKTNSAAGVVYYNNLIELAEIYDRYNIHRLKNTIPAHVQDVEGGDEYVLFIDMLGQHFDILWSYISALTSIHTREEHPKDGMPNDLLFHVAQSLGFNLLNGKSASDLWKYALNVDENGVALQSDVAQITSLSDSESTKEIWKRIVNNLPYILKTKGTSRSIKAMLTCFGIPSTVLTIKEYGGPSSFTDNDHYPEYIHDVFHYAWNSNTATGSLNLPIAQYKNSQKEWVPANTLELRFKTDNNYSYGVNTYYNILSIASGSIGDVYNLVLTKDTNDDNEGSVILFNRLTGAAVSASNLEIFDNSWHTVAITSENGTGSLSIAKSLYGNSIYVKSASINNGFVNSFPNSGSSYIALASGSRTITSTTLPNGSVVATLSKFYGHYQELRLWSGSLTQATIAEHAASPNTYTFNVDRTELTTGEEASKPYDHLFQRYTLSTKKINSGSFYQPSAHPNQVLNSGSLFYTGFDKSGSITFEGFEETYYTPSPSLGGSSLYSNKIRIESSSLDVNARLNTKTRIEKSSFDRYAVDSNRLGVYFSPQTAINEDIYNQLGYFEIDDYIGAPDDLYKDNYTSLTNFAIQYWKKYENRNDFEQYFRALQIYDFTIFKYIKRLIPHRANVIVGLVVEPNVLERSKVKIINKPTIQDLKHDAHLDPYYPEPIADYVDISVSLEWPLTQTAEYQSIQATIHNTQPEVISDAILERNGVIYIANTMEASATSANEGIIASAINEDQLGSSWVQHRYIGGYRITESGSFTPIQNIITAGRQSAYLLTVGDYFYSSSLSASLNLPYSSSLVKAEINNNHGLGYTNARYNGSKLTGPAINVNSTETVDGGPVIKVTQVNPNRIVFANNQLTTVAQSISGRKSRSLIDNG
jgi:hypothetical protein